MFGALAPDKAKTGNPGIMTVADGVFPLEDGYRPVPSFVTDFSGLPMLSKGGASFTASDGSAYIIAGTSSSLYKGSIGSWTLISAGFSTPEYGRWRFAQFGDLAIATNGVDPVKKINLSTDAISNLGGSPPTFEMLAVVKDFLVGGVRNGEALEMGWSAINNAESWTVGEAQSDAQIMPTGGKITGILSGEFGVVLQRNRISRMDYVGGNVIFTINEVSSNIGCVTPHSVAQWGRLGFFLSDEGFMMWNGEAPVPIGREIIDREFRERYDSGEWARMSAAVDPINSIVMWAMPDRIYMYHWVIQKWSTITMNTSDIFSGVVRGVSLDETDPMVGSADDILDTPGLDSFDDARFQSGEPTLYVFDQSGNLGSFRGVNCSATLTTNDLEPSPGYRTRISKVRLDMDAIDGVTVTLGVRQRQGDEISEYSFSNIGTDGDISTRATGRFVRPTVNIASGTEWSYIRGIDLIGASGGRR